MKRFSCLRVFVLACFLFQISCVDKKTETINEVVKLSLDDIETVPEWLKLNVDEVFGNDGMNVWVPTNNFQTSSLIRVPRFPRKFSDKEINKNPSLKDFEIINIPNGKILELTGVKNEQISAQIALGSKRDISSISIEIDNLSNQEGDVLNHNDINVRMVKYIPVQRARSEYVWSPKLETIIGEGVSGTMSPNIVGDPLIEIDTISLPAYRAQPVWLTFKIPENISSGTYQGNIHINSNEFEKIKYRIKLTVLDNKLPNPKDYKFYLDLWVNPSVIADYYKLEHWSDEHWKMISKYLKDYASRGGKSITTTITHEPWRKPWLNNSTRSQIAYGYKSMVQWTKNKNGNWVFDYSIFDKYVETATNLGFSGAINAFSMTPFLTKQKIYYLDEIDKKYKILEVDIRDAKYKTIWTSFLISFKKHLTKKNLFKRTYLGFDEKSEADMKILHDIIENAAPEFLNKIVIAGHPEAGKNAQNLAISYMFFPEQPLVKKAVVPVLPTIEDRKINNKITTFYLCAEPSHPNTLTYSPAVEAQLIPWLALKYNTSGYMRWAYNNWTENPFTNPVFIHNQGDDYYVYPGKEGPISSIRWELLKEGIEDYELFLIIKEKENISDKILQQAIELATKNQDGRYKNVYDIVMARNILLKKDSL